MFGTGFDLFLGTVCIVLAVVFFMGKGKGVLEVFSGRQKSKKRTPEQQKKYEFGFGIFCIVMAAGEFLMAFVDYSWVPLAAVVIAAADLIFIGWYSSNH